jgi:hypothetical protein
VPTTRYPDNANAYVMLARSGFDQHGNPILLGRDIDEHDTSKVARVAVVNEPFARKYLADRAPLGRIFHFGSSGDGKLDPKDAIEIVGVSKDAKYDTLKGVVTPTVYVTYAQNLSYLRRATFEVRTALVPMAISGAIRKAVAEIDRNVPVEMPLREQIQQSVGLEPYLPACRRVWIDAALLAAIGLTA